MKARAVAMAVQAALLSACAFAQSPAPDAARQRELVRIVRQDCGACHGMRLTGGLGPSLQAARLAEWPVEGLVATIANGRPGTPMPGWSPRMLSGSDVRWIAEQLLRGFPEEQRP